MKNSPLIRAAVSARVHGMSMSVEDRIEDTEKVLRWMMEELGDEPFDALFVDRDKVPYSTIRITTWKELLNHRLISDFGWRQYRFTGSGWLKGVEMLKLTADPDFAEKMSKLSATLRGYVTPRPEDDEMVDIFTVERDSGLTHGFIYNAIATRLLDRSYSRDGGAYFDPSDQNRHLIIVPYNYGLVRLPLYNTMRIVPSSKQWHRWSLPSKASYLGGVLAVISLVLWLATLPNWNTVWKKPSFPIYNVDVMWTDEAKPILPERVAHFHYAELNPQRVMGAVARGQFPWRTPELTMDSSRY